MRSMKGAMHMELNSKKINLKLEDDESFLVFDEYPEIKLDLSGESEIEIEVFFRKIIGLLLNESEFTLQLESDNQSSGLVEEVAKKYIDRLNIEISSICESTEYSEIRDSIQAAK